MIDNAQLKLAREFVLSTGKNIFLTGKAGTGKTTFLQQLKLQHTKRMIVVAPTGVAAINAGGVTIHSFFQLPFGPIIPGKLASGKNPDRSREGFRRFSREKINIMRSLDLLVIDEISMVRSDLLDGIDQVLRTHRDHSIPFGGVQLLMIGDLHQLAPVIKRDEWAILKDYYSTEFFFGSLALQQTSFLTIDLKEIFRQRDNSFIKLLNRIRENKINNEVLQALNSRYQQDISSKDFFLNSHNY